MTTNINADDGVVSGIAGLKTSADNSGILALQTNGTTAVTVNASQNVTFVNSANLPNTFGFKNRIINGDMRIDQRNAGASVTPTATNTYQLDRFKVLISQSSKFSVQQSGTAPTGFTNSALITSLAATSVGASDLFCFTQYIEGLNTADLAWGSAGASSVTISFWVRSSLVGAFGGSLQNAAGNRCYPFTYTISTANTWEQKTVTIVGDTSGTWLTTSGIGIRLIFGLGVGSNYSGTAGAWTGSSDILAPTGSTSVVSTNGANFYITGVQLEKGNIATSFDVRPYGTELQLCQRYYWQKGLESNFSAIGTGVMNATTQARIIIPYPVPMRTSPTITVTNIGNSLISQGGDISPSGSYTAYANTTATMIDIATATGTLGRGAAWIFSTLATTFSSSAEL
jgi:hypothetical protein